MRLWQYWTSLLILDDVRCNFFLPVYAEIFLLIYVWISEIKLLVLLTEVSLRGRICYGSNPKRSDKWRAAGNPILPTGRDGITGVFLSHPTSRALWGAPLGLQAAVVPRREGRAELRPPGGSSSPRAAGTWVPARHGRAEGSLGGGLVLAPPGPSVMVNCLVSLPHPRQRSRQSESSTSFPLS